MRPSFGLTIVSNGPCQSLPTWRAYAKRVGDAVALSCNRGVLRHHSLSFPCVGCHRSSQMASEVFCFSCPDLTEHRFQNSCEVIICVHMILPNVAILSIDEVFTFCPLQFSIASCNFCPVLIFALHQNSLFFSLNETITHIY